MINDFPRLIFAVAASLSFPLAAAGTPGTTADTNQNVHINATTNKTRAITASPDRPMAPAIKADLKVMSWQYTQKRYILAEQLGRQILQKDPTNLAAHYLMGSIYYQLKDEKSATAQYQYCIKTGRTSTIATMAANALQAMQKEFASGQNEPHSEPQKETSAPPTVEKKLDPVVRERCIHILELAQEALLRKKKEVDTTISHTEEFARSRIREIPLSAPMRKLQAGPSTGASRANEEFINSPNYDRPAEVARIRATETEKIKKLIEDFYKKQTVIVETALRQVDLLAGVSTDLNADKALEHSADKGTAEVPPASIGVAAKAVLSIREAYTICGISTSQDSFGQHISQIATGSPAHRAGLVEGDLIEQATYLPGSDLLKLNVRRNDNHYSVGLRPRAAQDKETIEAQTALLASKKNDPPKADSRTLASQRAWARIQESDIVFLVDMSYSMISPVGDTGLGRWEWAANRLSDFAEKVAGKSGKTFSLSECARYEYRLRDQSPQALRQYLLSSSPTGPANMSAPLANIVHDYIDARNTKPLLVVVFTAGHPDLGDSFEPTLRSISERTKNSDLVRIVFVQIGDDSEGTAMLKMLDDDLTYTGVRSDIVDYISFAELQSSGLSKALLDAYEKPRSVGNAIGPELSTILTKRLSRLQKQPQ